MTAAQKTCSECRKRRAVSLHRYSRKQRYHAFFNEQHDLCQECADKYFQRYSQPKDAA